MKILYILSIAALAVTAIVSGCDKNEINYGEFTRITETQALLKVNYNVSFRANPAVHIKINGTRVSGLLNTRFPYPGGGYNTAGDSRGDYLTVEAGNLDVSIAIPKRGTNIDSVEIYRTQLEAQAGKYYTLHVTDTAQTSSFVTEDDVSVPDSGYTKYRFVNLMPTVPAVDFYYGDSLISANVGYLKASDYVIKQIKPSVAWTIRRAGTPFSTAALATYTSANTILNKRAYTVFAVGYPGLTDTPRRPYVSFFFIR